MKEEEVVDPAHLHTFRRLQRRRWRTKRLGGGQIQMIQGGTGASKRRPLLKICSHVCLPLFMCVPPSPPSLTRGEIFPFVSFFVRDKMEGIVQESAKCQEGRPPVAVKSKGYVATS